MEQKLVQLCETKVVADACNASEDVLYDQAYKLDNLL